MVKHAWFLGLTDFSGYWVSTDTSSLGPSQICVTVVTTERSSHIPDGLSSVWTRHVNYLCHGKADKYDISMFILITFWSNEWQRKTSYVCKNISYVQPSIYVRAELLKFLFEILYLLHYQKGN